MYSRKATFGSERRKETVLSYRRLILFRAGIRDRKESQQSAVIDRKNVAIVLRKVDKLNGMFVTLTNLDDATGNMIKQQQRMLLEFAGFGRYSGKSHSDHGTPIPFH